MPIYSFDGVRPRIAADAYVHPDAVLIGDVEIGPLASIWPAAVLRGDFGRIIVGARTSVQDGTVVHTTAEWLTEIGERCVIGHNAHLEACVVEDGCLIASMSTVLGRARVGAGSIVGAGALVPERLQIPAASIAIGVPVRVRPLPAYLAARIAGGENAYVEVAKKYPSALQQVSLGDCRVEA